MFTTYGDQHIEDNERVRLDRNQDNGCYKMAGKLDNPQ